MASGFRAGRSFDSPPSRPPTLPSDEDMKAGLQWSLILHGGAIGLFLLFSVVFPGTPKPWVPTLRVDIVGLPEVLKKNLHNSESSKEISKILKKAEEQAKQVKPKKLPPLPKPTELAKPDDMVLHALPEKSGMSKHREAQLMAALARMKALAQIQSEIHPVQYKGNKISKGNSVSGDAKESDQSDYYDTVLERLRDNWSLPRWLSNQDLSARVQIYIDARGRLHDFQFLKLSGNSQFDEAVKRALEQSEPFPTPPRSMATNVLVNGIIFGFPL